VRLRIRSRTGGVGGAPPVRLAVPTLPHSLPLHNPFCTLSPTKGHNTCPGGREYASEQGFLWQRNGPLHTLFSGRADAGRRNGRDLAALAGFRRSVCLSVGGRGRARIMALGQQYRAAPARVGEQGGCAHPASRDPAERRTRRHGARDVGARGPVRSSQPLLKRSRCALERVSCSAIRVNVERGRA
jgi:hypothetical protein